MTKTDEQDRSRSSSRSPADTSNHAIPESYISAEIPGIGGVLKRRPEDFLVDEQPLYQPCGSGEHVYMLVQKRGMSTMDMIEIIARHFGVMRRDVGVAGLKDKVAITRQVVSVHVPGKTAADFPFLSHEKLAVLWSDQHTNKLRRGHLRGNRFSIKVREVSPACVVQASKVLTKLAKVGLPNRIGEQRFGMLQNNHLVGQALIAREWDRACDLLVGPSAEFPNLNPLGRALYASGDYVRARDSYPRSARAEQRVLHRLSQGDSHRSAILQMDGALLGFFLSAFQSAVFNATLEVRLRGVGVGTLVEGDLAMKHENRACFAVDQAVASDPETRVRVDAFEVSPTGPLWGVGLSRAGGDVDRAEVAALASYGLSPVDLDEWERVRRGLLEGERRPMRVPLIDPDVEGGVDEHGAYVRCAFELPRGCFATVVMREVMKPTAPMTEETDD